MDKEYARILARIRMERAVELLSEAQDLLAKESYKSANNRAFYSIEKSIKALLAIVGKEVQTHSGDLKQFNLEFITMKQKLPSSQKSADYPYQTF